MQINLTGHHLELTDAIKDYVQEKMQKLERHREGLAQIQVILSVQKLVQKAEAKIHIKGSEIFANAESEDLYAAIDLLVDKLDRQLLKHKEKQMKRRA